MDLTARESNPPHHATKSQESDTDTETPLQTHLSKALSLTNGSLSRHRTPSQPLTVVSYRECLKNHAASLGGVVLDGCGEFMPTPSANLLDPSSLKCAACGCHRNFHRRDNHHHHHHQQPTPPVLHWTPSPSPSSGPSPSPSSPASPTPQQSLYPAAPHMLLALSHTGGVFCETRHQNQMVMSQHGRKRARTKFTEEQRQKMQSFAEKLGWKMLRGNDEKMVQDFCSEVGVKRNVFKVWMHNNKHRRDKAHDGDISVNKNKVININGDDERFSEANDLDKYQIEKRVDVHGGSTTDDGSSPDR